MTYTTNTLQVSTVNGKTTVQNIPPSSSKYTVVTAPVFTVEPSSTNIYDSVETDALTAFCYNGAAGSSPTSATGVVVSAPTTLVNQAYDLY